mgnify:CR=1 FL=1|jgi:hypothetical protein
MSKVVLGVLLGFSGLSYFANQRSNKIRTYLDDNYGRKAMDAVGYAGGALQLAAVTAVSRGWLVNTSSAYHLISLVGSTGLLLTAFYHEAMAPVLVNIIWMGMNTVGVFEGISNMSALEQATSILG